MRPFHCIFIFLLSLSQFLPLAFCVMALPTILLSQGLPMDQIGFIYLAGIIWVLKFLWAPLVDRIGFGKWGHYKIWLLLMQSLLVLTVITFIFVGNDQSFGLILSLALILAVFASTQDIAADAIACRLIPEGKRGLGSALQLSGGLASTMLGGGGVLILYEQVGWRACMWAIAAAVAFVLVFILLFDEGEIENKSGTPTNRPTFKRLFSFWMRPGMGIWALILVFLPISVTIVWSLASPILLKEGWTTDKIGIVLHIAAPVFGILLSFAFGYALNRFNKWVVIAIVPVLQVGSILLFFYAMDTALGTTSIIIAALLVYGIDISLYVILNAFKLEYSEEGTEGTDFTVQNSLHGFTAFIAAGGALYFAEMTGFANLMLASAAFAIASGILLYAIVMQQLRKTKNAYAA